MATRQYIGARYVPKFYQNSVDGSTQWESNVVYDPLIYVTLQNGHMYISKKEVPATVGTPAQNIDYWLDVGSYDGYIEELQEQIDAINEKLTREPEVICIGDSFLQQTENWGKWLKTRMNVANDKFHVSGVPQMGFYDNHFRDQLNTVISGLAHPENVTHIIVIGGTNDINDGTLATVNDGIDAFFATAASCPNAKVYIGFAGTRFGSTYYQTDSVYNKSLCYRYYERGCAVHQATFIPNITESLFTDGRVKSDWIHPTEEGAAIIADIIYGAINGSTFDVPARYKENVSVNATQVSGTVTYSLAGAQRHSKLTINGLVINSITLSSQTWMQILTYDELPIKPSIMHIKQGVARINTVGSTDYEMVNITLQLSVNGLRFRLDGNIPEPSGTKKIELYQCPIEFDLMPIL